LHARYRLLLNIYTEKNKEDYNALKEYEVYVQAL
jgi:hypothetical protein